MIMKTSRAVTLTGMRPRVLRMVGDALNLHQKKRLPEARELLRQQAL
jgi:hypothetical protein